MKIENTKAQMRKGVLEFCILSILVNGDAYASDIIATLKEVVTSTAFTSSFQVVSNSFKKLAPVGVNE